MATIETSEKLIYEEFKNELENIPLDVYYQTIISSQYTSNNVQFKFQAPVPGRSLLDTDVWIKYNIRFYETVDYSLLQNVQSESLALNANTGNLTSTPAANDRFGLRGGNIMWKAMQNLMITINNQSLNLYPHKFIDVWNRLHVSNEQAEHEFSASGGRFDDGNHGHRTKMVRFEERIAPISAGLAGTRYKANEVINGWAAVANADDGLAALTTQNNTYNRVYWIDSYYTSDQPTALQAAKDLYCHMRPPYPLKYEFYNPGFDDRVNKFINKIRSQTNNMNTSIVSTLAAPNANAYQFVGEGVVAGHQNYFLFEIFERLPCPLFKMYSNDNKYGVIPNIRDMQIQINWLATAVQNMIKSNNAALGVGIYWDGITANDAELYLRWYTPPMTVNIPMEVSIPYTHIDIQSFSHASQVPAAANRYYDSTTFTQYNISLQAVPDLLLIYAKIPGESYSIAYPDDYNLEIRNLVIDIDSSSGKLNSIQTIDLYKKWKQNLKHGDTKIIGYDEWRKYCCVAVLKPEDIGLKIGPGMSHLCSIGVKCDFRNWHNNPSIMYTANEPLGGAAAAAINCQVQIVAVYNKYKLTLGSNGVGKLELQRLGDEIRNLGGPNLSAEPMLQMRGRLEY